MSRQFCSLSIFLTSHSITGSTIEVRVGSGKSEAQESFHVHRNVLQQTSPFFQNRLKAEGDNRERFQEAIELPEDGPSAFRLYVTWLYSHSLSIEDDDKNVKARYLAEAYVLGERIMDDSYKDTIMKALISYSEKADTVLGSLHVGIIYTGTPEGSPARQLLVAMYSWGVSGYTIPDRDCAKTYHSEFLQDLVVALLSKRGEPHTVCSAPKPWIECADTYLIKNRSKQLVKEPVQEDVTVRPTNEFEPLGFGITARSMNGRAWG